MSNNAIEKSEQVSTELAARLKTHIENLDNFRTALAQVIVSADNAIGQMVAEHATLMGVAADLKAMIERDKMRLAIEAAKN